MRELQGDLSWPKITQTHRTIKIQFRVVEIRPSAELHVFAMRLRQDCHVAYRLPIQHNIAEVNLTIDDRRIFSAGTYKMEAGLPLHREPRQLNALKVCKVNVGSGQVKAIILVP